MHPPVRTLLASLALVAGCAAPPPSPDPMPTLEARQAARAATFAARDADWRQGAIVYQVLVDRFAPPADLEAKRALYPPPKRLRRWDETPQRGHYLDSHRVWSHEIEFWGGDLDSLRGRLDHVQNLGATVLYLNPIHLAWTNHKYDALDHQQVSPEFGTRDDVKALAAEIHRRGMKLVLDGVFNHMGRNAPRFQHAQAHAQAHPESPWRDWFVFGAAYPGGARAWWLAENLPELNLENPKVRDALWNGRDSVVRSWLRDGADGWRLDVAVDIGYQYLDELTRAAHAEKPGSLVVGEIANYPSGWIGPVDGVMNFSLREILLRLADGRLPPPRAAAMVERMVNDSGIEGMLKSWLFLDNHDSVRLANALPDERRRRLAQALQFTLPAAPNLYYGSEIGMTGGDDPEMRAPMRWQDVREDNPHLRWTHALIQLHKSQRALRIGDFRRIESERLFAFERHTDRAAETAIVLANPSDADVTETVMVANPSLMNTFALLDQLPLPPALAQQKVVMRSGLIDVTVPAHGVRVLTPQLSPGGGYSSYKRVP